MSIKLREPTGDPRLDGSRRAHIPEDRGVVYRIGAVHRRVVTDFERPSRNRETAEAVREMSANNLRLVGILADVPPAT